MLLVHLLTKKHSNDSRAGRNLIVSARTEIKYLGPQWLHHFDSVLVEINRAAITLPSFLIIHAFGSPFDEKNTLTTIGHGETSLFQPVQRSNTSGRNGFSI